MDLCAVQISIPHLGRHHLYHLPNSQSVGQIKELIRHRHRVLAQEQTFVNYAGDTLHDAQALWDLRGQVGEPLQLTVNYSPLSRPLVFAGGSGHAKGLLFDLECGDVMHPLAIDSEEPMLCASVDWTGMRALVGGWDSSLRVMELDSGTCSGKHVGHSCAQPGILCVAADWQAMRAVTGGQDCTLQVWDLQRLGPLGHPLLGHEQHVWCVQADFASRRAVSGSQDRTLRLWSLDHGQPLQEMRGHSGTVFCISVDWAYSRALSGSWDCTLRVWDLTCGGALQELRGHTNAVFCCAMDWYSGRAVSGGSDNNVLVWDLKKGERVRTLIGHTESVTCLDVNWSCDQVLSGSSDGSMRLWNLTTGEILQTLQGSAGSLGDVRFALVRWQAQQQQQAREGAA